MEFVKKSVARAGAIGGGATTVDLRGGVPGIARAARTVAAGPLRRLARRFPGLKRSARTLLQRTRARAYRIRRRLRSFPKLPGSAGARLGVYVAYFDAAEIYRIHLAAFQQTCTGPFNYYVMKNCTTALE